MKKLILSLALLGSAVSLNAQQDLYALTGKSGPNIIFNDFRSLDVKNGISGDVFLNDTSSPEVFSQVQNSRISDVKNLTHGATATSMATLAYDGENLIYMPLFSSNIYVLNSKSKKVTLLETPGIKTTACNLGSQFTRMTTGFDGSIYALTNSGSQFLKITNKNGKYEVKDLGTVQDVSGSSEVSLTQMNTGFGGDMVADSDNNFYVFAASGNIFKINSESLSAVFVGKIKGLPENFSLNGAAVNANGKITVASAKAQGFFEVNLENLEAKPLNNNLNFPVYDLASRYFVNDNRAANTAAVSDLSIFPTKVDQKFVNISIPSKMEKSKLTVSFFDASGALVSKKSLSQESGVQRMDLQGFNQGVYIVNVADNKGKVISTSKILVTN